MSDAALVMAVARWRQEALEEIYRRHAGAVFALACRVTNDRSRAEDITQETFVRLWNEPDRFDPERGSLRAYLLTRTHSRSVDVIRSETSRRRREERDARHMEAVVDDLEREVLDLAMAEQVRTAFDALPADERNAIELAYFKGHTYREAARLLDQPEGTVKSRIRSGLRRLRQGLPASMEEI